MEKVSLEDCIKAIHGLENVLKTTFAPDIAAALAEAVFLLAQMPRPKDTRVDLLNVARNYYQDGPMVHELLDQRDTLLWEQWHGYLVGYAHLRKGVPLQTAEDLAQEACLRVLESLTKFRYDCSLKTFFSSVFNHVFLEWLRWKGRQPSEVSVTDERDDQDETVEAVLVDDQPLPEEQAVMALIQQHIQRIVNDVQWQVITLYYREKWTDKAIGEKLDMPMDTVTSIRRRTLARLRDDPQLAFLHHLLVEPNI